MEQSSETQKPQRERQKELLRQLAEVRAVKMRLEEVELRIVLELARIAETK